MCRDGRFSLPPPDDDANGSKAGRRDDPTRDADDDAKTYESIECQPCASGESGASRNRAQAPYNGPYAGCSLCPIQAWMARGIVAGIGKDSRVHRCQVLPARTDRDRPWPPNRRMYPADTVAIPPIPCQLKGLPEWMRVDLPFSLSGRQFYRLDQLRIIRIRFRAIDPLRYRPTFTPQVRPNRSTRNHCGVCGRNDDRDECLYFCTLE
jgi:hypothetical protein